MLLLPGLLFMLWGEPARCLEENGGFTFDGDIRHFAVAANTVYVATEERLYQLSHDLTLVQSLSQRGILSQTYDAHFSRVADTDERSATFGVNILLPFVKNDALISCGVIECGYCEVLDLKNISNVRYREHIQVGSPLTSSASVGFLVDVERVSSTETYILTANQQYEPQYEPATKSCSFVPEAVHLHNTNHHQRGSMFSLIDPDAITSITRCKRSAEFVDGFQINFIIYLFSNLPSSDGNNTVRLIWLEGKTSKQETLESLRGATLRVSDGDGGEGSTLLASAVIPGGPPVLWSGVFSVDGGQTNTELVLFDISPDLSGVPNDPDFCNVCPLKTELTTKTLKPKAVLFRQKYMTSVLAVRQKAWVVFFIGTADGQLIKLSVDKNDHPTCPKVLYRTNDDQQVFPKILLDQVDLKHVYMPLQNQMKRVPVSDCSTYTTVQDCWSAQDPYCVWCGSKNSCTFEDDCQDSDWISIPDDFQPKMVSYKVVKDDSGEISLNMQTHLTVGQEARSNFACQFSVLCSTESPPPQFPQCTCILSNSTLPAEGLPVTVEFKLGKTQLREELKLSNCSDISGPPTSVLGKRKITLMGSHLDFVEGVMHNHALQEVRPPRNRSHQNLTYDTPAADEKVSSSALFLKVANETVACSILMNYYPDPEFTSFTSTRAGDGVRIILQKKADKLEMTPAELSVWGVEEGNQHPCIMEAKETSHADFFICTIQRTPNAEFQHLKVKYGDKTVKLGPPPVLQQVILTVRMLLIPFVVLALVIVCRWQKRLTAEMNAL